MSLQNIKIKLQDRIRYNETLKQYNALVPDNSNFIINKKYEFKCKSDYRESAGHMGNYFWQDLWAAKLVINNRPDKHYDIGSRVDGFIGHLAASIGGVVLIDIRPLDIKIPGVDYMQADATNLTELADNSIKSISALSSIEHFGLGRYGDPIDPNASMKVMKSISRVLETGGHAYISVPVGWEHLEFNAHRVFYASTVVDNFAPLKLVEYSCVYKDSIEYNVDVKKYDNDRSYGGKRFGLFHFIKI